ncbi:DUF4258 domain-containing protein [Nocardiopsis lambiniae]|uniref:DUF4258 domain-containing protein n=1 Tax=Nocardiopsis lambiniae TaxID=3075539 RepID=A0ABU2M619_9ACTN|nr:DUF4258 domain-containing protein [Nocardiopsis sp. DSM 44743]MDT0328097.1 DUF4258 domain-containing protein [Nocardiopsis sp. DSM 44743]
MRKRHSAWAIGIVAALLISDTAVVAAEEREPSPDRILERIDGVADTVALADALALAEAFPGSAPAGPPGTATVAADPEAAVSIPLDGADAPMRVDLPRPEGAEGFVGDSGSVLFTGGSDDFASAARAEDLGGARLLVYIASADAPDEYAFDIDLPEGAELVELEDGGAAVRTGDGHLAGTFAPPWAVDAHGTPVPTSYRVDRGRLVQRVTVGATTAFPVVADPFWIPVLAVGARFTAHALTQMAKRKVSQKLVQQVVQNGRKTAGKKGTSVFTQGSGKNRVRVIVDNKSGNIITVTKG